MGNRQEHTFLVDEDEGFGEDEVFNFNLSVSEQIHDSKRLLLQLDQQVLIKLLHNLQSIPIDISLADHLSDFLSRVHITYGKWNFLLTLSLRPEQQQNHPMTNFHINERLLFQHIRELVRFHLPHAECLLLAVFCHYF